MTQQGTAELYNPNLGLGERILKPENSNGNYTIQTNIFITSLKVDHK